MTVSLCIVLSVLDVTDCVLVQSLMPSLSCENTNMSVLTEQAARLLDFSQKLDIQLLDNVIGFMYSGAGQQVMSLH